MGDEDVGYGPARLFDPTEVFQIASVLDQHAEGSLRSRYDGRAMNSAKVYPQIWGREEEDNFDYALENFIALREFVHGVRDSQSYLMVYLT